MTGTMTTAVLAGSTDSGLCVRPAWGHGDPMLSARARRLLIQEWGRLGILPEPHDDEDALLAGVQQRAATVTSLADRTPAGAREVVTTATGPSGAPEASWPELAGILLS